MSNEGTSLYVLMSSTKRHGKHPVQDCTLDQVGTVKWIQLQLKLEK